MTCAGIKNGKRLKSDITERHVAHVRWLHEVQGVGPTAISQRTGLSIGRIDKLLQYMTWCDIDPAPHPEVEKA